MNETLQLQSVTGKILTFKFSPEGALSSARLGKQNVTAELHYLKEKDYKQALQLFGFRDDWPKEAVNLFSSVNKQLKQYELEIMSIYEVFIGQFNVSVCNLKDLALVHKITRGVLQYDVSESKFVRVVKQFDLDQAICDEILKGDYVQDQKDIQD